MTMREVIVSAGIAIAILGVLVGFIGCKRAPALNPAQLATNAGYDARLVECKATGKASGSFAVFEACERAASRQLCAEHIELRGTWARCAEVLP